MDINIRGVFVATQAALKHMKSVVALSRSARPWASAPDARPRALLGYKGKRSRMFTQGLSREVASRGITVNNVQPGPIDTDTNPPRASGRYHRKPSQALGRYGHVDEVAALVAFVAGPESSYITGPILTWMAE